MILHLATRLNRLERSRGMNVICTTCHDAGIWVAHYENDPTPALAPAPGRYGCPECGRCNTITVRYVAPTMPTCITTTGALS